MKDEKGMEVRFDNDSSILAIWMGLINWITTVFDSLIEFAEVRERVLKDSFV